MKKKFSNGEIKSLAAKLAAVFAILCLFRLLVFFFVSSGLGATRVHREFRVMGGIPLTITFCGESEKRLQEAVEAAYKSVALVDSSCNRFDPSSELSKLNATAFGRPFHCRDPLWDILMESKRYYELTDGEFDISATPFMTLWGFHRERKTLPTPAEIAEASKRSGLSKVRFDMKNHTVEFTVPGMALDLGGIAKGYAVGLAAKTAAKFGIERGMINLSGNAYCFPKPFPGKSAYTVGIKNPLDKSKIGGSFSILNSSMATSGNYERYVVINGRHYAHIMNPQTGRPVENM
ncbi:MAG: FAD:protein FMN transferase, partial [Kiritimatiellaeota bacterium]|nr:FAD:protein FMN transferase [Kiritimatiellota bacterium]